MTAAALAGATLDATFVAGVTDPEDTFGRFWWRALAESPAGASGGEPRPPPGPHQRRGSDQRPSSASLADALGIIAARRPRYVVSQATASRRS